MYALSGNKIGKNRDTQNRKLVQSNRERILHRIFKMYCNKGFYTHADFHAFCHFAKCKSESKLLQFEVTA